jgi:hypothetical protein|tara:strand:+ start:1740 stop:2021 length:282 start_codon:yes stop_codon:yes gene_type:complete
MTTVSVTDRRDDSIDARVALDAVITGSTPPRSRAPSRMRRTSVGISRGQLWRAIAPIRMRASFVTLRDVASSLARDDRVRRACGHVFVRAREF